MGLNFERTPEKAEMLKVANPLLEQVRQLAVASAAAANDMAAMLVSIKEKAKFIKEKFAGSVKAAYEAHKAVKALENECLAPLEEAEKLAKSKLAAFEMAERERERKLQIELQAKAEADARKERERLEVEAAKAREAGETEMADAMVEQASMTVAIPMVVSTERSKTPGVSFTTTWGFEVVDLDLVPREYLVVDEQKLGAVAKATKGALKIPGIKFVEKTGVSARCA